jgi:predicted phosphodiesterase
MAVKLAFTSDLHLPLTSAEVLTDFAEDIARQEPDVLAIAGDIGETALDPQGCVHVELCLNLFTSFLTCPVLVVAGNHDLWVLGKRRNASVRIWQTDLPAAVERAGCIWLEGQAHVVGNVALAGTIAWYDYSAADPTIEASAATFAERKYEFNKDADRIDWPWTDLEFASMVAEPFLKTLDRLEADPAIRQTVVFTHVPLLECQMCRKPENRDWGFSNAYFGNLTLGAEVIQRRKVTHIVSGHTHVPRHALVKLTDGRTLDARVLNSQYGRPAWETITLDGTD